MSRRRRVQKIVPEAPRRMERIWFNRVIPLLILCFAYVNIIAGSLFYPLDYDLGWHLRYGQDVVENHVISSVNTYSAEMTGFHWRNSSWASDVARYLLFKYFSFQGLMVAGVITMLVTFYIFAKGSKFSYWEAALVFPVIAYIEIPLTSASFRAQLLSFTGMGLIIWIISSYQAGNKKALWFLPLLFLVWANIHGGFFLGILYLLAWTFLYIFKEVYLEKSQTLGTAIKSHAIWLLLATFAGVLASLINPWGLELYVEHVFTDIGTRFEAANPEQYLVEWKPLFNAPGLFVNHTLFGFLLLAATAVLVLKKKFREMLPLLTFVILFYVLAIFTRRFAWTTYFLAMPILGTLAASLKPKNPIIAHSIALLVSIFFFGYMWVHHIGSFDFRKMDWNAYCYLTGCSPSSAQHVKANLANRKIYTTYDWGGWLIWNYPEIKPGVDGRMSTWTDEKGHNAFIQYVMYEQDRENIDTADYEVVYLSPGKQALFNRMLALVEEGRWSISYKDGFAFVFVRNKNSYE